jgi:hypothetical protein
MISLDLRQLFSGIAFQPGWRLVMVLLPIERAVKRMVARPLEIETAIAAEQLRELALQMSRRKLFPLWNFTQFAVSGSKGWLCSTAKDFYLCIHTNNAPPLAKKRRRRIAQG